MIFVDSREPKRIVEILRKLGVHAEVKTLDTGDYLVKHQNYEIPVERKEMNDFLNSIVDGRLFRQCHLLSAKYPLSFLAIIGDMDDALEIRDFSRNAVIAAIISIAVKNAQGQIIPLTFKDDWDFCLALKALDGKVVEGDLRVLPRLKKLEKPQIAMLTAIPGIGEKKAEKILKYFGSIYRIANASVSELMRVDGIGEKKAREIYRFFRQAQI